MPDVHELTLVQAAEAIRSGEISPTSLVGALLDRIDRLDPVLQAWVTVDREGAMRTAEERERQLQQGNVLGPLHGIPIGVKDIFHVEGLPTIAGSSLYADRVSSYDATSVARLKDAGAIVLGKTVTCQFASTDPGPTRNPWNPEHTPGGSSQGSGRRSRPACASALWGRRPADRCSGPRRTADSSASSPPTAGSAGTASFPSPGPSIPSASFAGP